MPFLERYLRFHFGRAGWSDFLAENRADVILWPADGAVVPLIAARPEWRLAYRDSLAVVFERVSGRDRGGNG
jgi:hypothetical protein